MTTSVVQTLTAEQLATQLADIVAQLRVMAGTEKLEDVIDDGMNWQLGRRAQDLFGEIDSLLFLAGLPRMPHCRGCGDDEQFDLVIAVLEHVAQTRTLPEHS